MLVQITEWQSTIGRALPRFTPGVHALAHDLGDKSVLTPHDTRLPNVSPGGADRVAAGLEWIAAVPEPRAIVFLGTALLVASGIARRRFMRNGKVQKS